MRALESAPLRYDAGMRLLTLGRVDRLHAIVAEAAAKTSGGRVLEIGCGTGSVTARLAALGARVTALDQSPEMLEQAQARVSSAATLDGTGGAGGTGTVEWLERTAAEVDAFPEASFDAAVVSLCFSDMAASERAFVLRQVAKVLRPGGVLAVADEMKPRGRMARAAALVLRAPQALLAWLIVGSTSRPIADLGGELRAAGFSILEERRFLFGTLGTLIAERPA
jgi:demethylmenaquinone methyltransferase/2-methoxy-6-polyprenyl-1,4-benzoquinol methylase